MRVLVDFHHHALAESLLRLFDDRYGVDVYFPAGMGWYERGYWNFERAWHGDAVARQYLEGIWADGEWGEHGVFRRDPRHPGRWHNGVTVERALDMVWDLVISTLPHNDEGMHRFATVDLPANQRARFGLQIGNVMQDSRYDLAEFALSSSTLPGHTTPDSWAKVIDHRGVPTVIYHQEFDAQGVFRFDPDPAAGSREVASWVNCFPETAPYPGFLDFARRHADDFDFKVYGAYGSAAADELAAGDVSVVTDVADRMREARVGFHMKAWSDGFGHVIHNWAAVGRPIVWVADYYRDKLAAPLFVEGVNAWDIGRHTEAELVALMRRLRDDDEFWLNAATASRDRFDSLVSFDAEAQAIAGMLGL